jgi:hypothetical protein
MRQSHGKTVQILSKNKTSIHMGENIAELVVIHFAPLPVIYSTSHFLATPSKAPPRPLSFMPLEACRHMLRSPIGTITPVTP